MKNKKFSKVIPLVRNSGRGHRNRKSRISKRLPVDSFVSPSRSICISACGVNCRRNGWFPPAGTCRADVQVPTEAVSKQKYERCFVFRTPLVFGRRPKRVLSHLNFMSVVIYDTRSFISFCHLLGTVSKRNSCRGNDFDWKTIFTRKRLPGNERHERVERGYPQNLRTILYCTVLFFYVCPPHTLTSIATVDADWVSHRTGVVDDGNTKAADIDGKFISNDIYRVHPESREIYIIFMRFINNIGSKYFPECRAHEDLCFFSTNSARVVRPLEGLVGNVT